MIFEEVRRFLNFSSFVVICFGRRRDFVVEERMLVGGERLLDNDL